MNCEVCQRNTGVARCKKCGKVICKNCGRYCPNCKSAVCTSHLRRLENGKWVCELCAPKYLRSSIPPKAPNQTSYTSTSNASTSQKQQTVKESLSFEDLIKDIGEVSIKLPGVEEKLSEEKVVREEVKPLLPLDDEKVEEVINPFAEKVEPKPKIKVAQEQKQEQGYKHLKRKPSDDPNEFRILTASAPKPTPMWVSGLMSGILAFVLCIPLVKNLSLPIFPKLFAYSVLILAGGTIIWNGYGLFFDNNTRENRLMCLPGLLLGVITAIVALIFGLR